MITLKIGKVICPVCDVKNSNRVFHPWATLGLFLLKIKIERKRKLDSFFFLKEKIFLKHLKIITSPSREPSFKFTIHLFMIASFQFKEEGLELKNFLSL